MQCPKCNVNLEPSGELDVDGEAFTVYQCEHCLVPWHFDGKTFDVSFSFAVSESGQLIHPETLEPIALN